MAERAHPEDPAFQGTKYERHLRERYAQCQGWVTHRRVLDAACGTGWGTSLLHGAAALTAVDIDVSALRYGAGHYPAIRFAAANLAALPFAAGSFETVLCLEGLEHVFGSEAAAFLREAHRVLCDGGLFVATVPLLNNGRHSGNPYHLFEYTRETVEGLFAPCFETVARETEDGPEGPELRFVGRRREPPGPLAAAGHDASLSDPVVAGTLRWLESVSGSTGCSYAPGGPITILSTCLGILHAESAGATDPPPSGRLAGWVDQIRSSQREADGLFCEPLFPSIPPGPSHDEEYLLWQTTYFALAALDAARAAPVYRLGFILPFLAPGMVEAWLSSLDWSNPWRESNRVMFLLHALIHAVERQDDGEHAVVYHRVLDWLDGNQDSATGLWGTQEGASLLNAVAGAYHFVPFYEYVRRPIRGVNRIIDSVLRLQKSDALFGPETGGGACEDLDAVAVLATLMRYTGHRRREVRTALVRAWWAVWNLRNEDGSFPYSGRDTTETYSFSGWTPLTAGLRTGDIWSTWFRMQALATVSSAAPGDVPAVRWRFRRWPALGYHSEGQLSDQDRVILPKWLRRNPPPEHTRELDLTVVVTCYNLGRYLPEAVASVLGQTSRPSRIVVVDDGSTDAYTNFLLDHWPYDGVELIRTSNRGVAAARNLAIERASTEFVLCLDADDRLRQTYCEKAVRYLAENAATGFVSCYYELFDCDGGVYRYDDCNLPAMLVRNEAVVSSVFRKAAWEKAGGYCEDLSGLHDWDLWIGILENKYRGAVLREILFDYRSRPNSMYSQTTQPATYAGLLSRIVQRHEKSFRRHMTSVVAGRARQFIEVVRLRAREIEQHQRERGKLQSLIDEAAVAASGHLLTIESIEGGKSWLQQQLANWQHEAEQRGAIISGLEQAASSLRGQVDSLTAHLVTQKQLVDVHLQKQSAFEQRTASQGAELRLVSERLETALRQAGHDRELASEARARGDRLESDLQIEKKRVDGELRLLSERLETALQQAGHDRELANEARLRADRVESDLRIERERAEGTLRLMSERLGTALQQAAHDRELASEALRRADRLDEVAAQLAGLQKELRCECEATAKHNAALSSAMHAMLRRPGILLRVLRNSAILVSAASSRRTIRNLALWAKVLAGRDHRALWNTYFDPALYLTSNTDVCESGTPPWLHYIAYGGREERQCSALFDSGFYLRRHPDVASAEFPPLLHYVLFGSREARSIAPPLNPRPASSAQSDCCEASGVDVTTSASVPGPSRPSSRRRLRSQREPAGPGARGGDPLVSVIIPCFNYGRYLGEAVRSVLEQTLSSLELIVVEGGSTDGTTPAVLQELEKSGLPRTRCLYRAEPHRTGDNRNFGIQSARGKYICCLDADDKLSPVYLEAAAFLAETYGFDLVYPSVQAFGADDFLWRLYDADHATILDYNQVSTVGVFRRSVWEEIGGYRDWGRGAEYVAEDWDFWVRLLRNGFRAACIPQALLQYRVHESGLWHHGRDSVDYQRRRIAEGNASLLNRDVEMRPLTPQRHQWRDLLDARQSHEGALLLALPFVTIGGAERIFEAIARSAILQGRRVVIITSLVLPDSVQDNSEHFQKITPTFYALPQLLGSDVNRWDDFLSYLVDRYSVDLIMIAGCDYLYQVLPDLAETFPAVGVVDQLFNDQVHFPTNRHYSQYIDLTIVPSQPFADRLVTEFAEEPGRVAVIPHGVAVPAVPDTSSISLARERSGLPSEWKDRRLIGFFGRMSPEKGPKDFVEIARVLSSVPNTAFVMTGDGAQREAVMQLIRRYGLETCFYAPGFVEDPQNLILSVDVVVVPSRLDGMPLIVMESQALSKPVVASAVGTIPVMIEHGRTGLLCRPGDIDGFAAEILGLLYLPERIRNIGLAARQSVEARHSAEAMIRGYEEQFAKVRALKSNQERDAAALDPLRRKGPLARR